MNKIKFYLQTILKRIKRESSIYVKVANNVGILHSYPLKNFIEVTSIASTLYFNDKLREMSMLSRIKLKRTGN